MSKPDPAVQPLLESNPVQATALPPRQPADAERKVPDVDWEWHRARLIASRDTEGLELLDACLVEPHDRARECEILDALNSRECSRKLRAELRPAIEADTSTPVGVCTRWKLLAEWASRFGGQVMNFGFDGSSPGSLIAERMYPPKPGELPAPELAWARAFRDSTQSLIPLVLEQDLDDLGLQTLVRDMEEVLDGKAVEVAEHVREVELIVRTLLGRLSTPGDNSVQGRRGVLVAVHEVAKILVGRLKALVELVHQYRQIGVGLLRLDYHLHLPPGEDPDPGEPERAARWRTAIATLKADLSKATAVWTRATASPDQWLERTLVAAGKGANCGPVTRPSCHELVIVLGRGILDPSSLDGSDSEPLDLRGGVTRLRVVGALSGDSWRDIIENLDREFEKAIELLPASTGRLVEATVGPALVMAPQEQDATHGHPKALRVGYRDVCNGRADLGLPRTPKTTYTRWCQNPTTASDLGVNPKGLVSAQQPLVEGLIRLHAQKSSKRLPPQQRGKKRL